MSNKENKKELSDDELKDVNGSMKIVVNDDNPDEMSWWEKVLKIFFKTK